MLFLYVYKKPYTVESTSETRKNIDVRELFGCQLAKFRIVRGIRLYDTLLWQVCYTIKMTHLFLVLGWRVTVEFRFKMQNVLRLKLEPIPIHEDVSFSNLLQNMSRKKWPETT